MVPNDAHSSEETQIVASRLTPLGCFFARTLLLPHGSRPRSLDLPVVWMRAATSSRRSNRLVHILVLQAHFRGFGDIAFLVVSRGLFAGTEGKHPTRVGKASLHGDKSLLSECYHDHPLGIDADKDVLQCNGLGPQRRMNTDGRAERTVTDSGFSSSTTVSTTTAAGAAATSDSGTSSSSSSSFSSSSASWHSAISVAVSLSEPHVAPAAPYGLRLGSAGFFRPPLTPLEQPGPATARIYPPFDHGSLFPGTASQFSPGFYPRLAHPRPSYSPAGAMTAGLQQGPPQSPYLASSEPFASSLIPITPLPHHLIQPQMQYPSYVVGSLGGDTIGGRHHVLAQQQHHHRQQQQQPSPLPLHRQTPAELFQRSPMPEETAHRDDRPSHLHHPHMRDSTAGPRTLVYFSPPPMPALSHHVVKKNPADTGLAPSARVTVKDPFAAGRSTRGSVTSRVPQALGEPTPHRSAIAHRHSTGQTRSPVPPTESRRPLTPPEASAQPQQPHYPPHFVRGSIIQLGNGQQKRVEELETRDFVESAGISENLQIDSSTVVHMRQNHERNTVILGFSVGQQNIQVTVEATLEHPFFVYNQGWSSYSPERTLLRYGLSCHQLRVGNCCISLTQRDAQSPPAGATSSTPQHPPTTYPEPRRGSSSRPHRSPQISHALGAPEPGPRGETEGAQGSWSSTGPSEQHSQSSPTEHSGKPLPKSSGIATHSVGSFAASASSSISTRIPHMPPPPPPPPLIQLVSSSEVAEPRVSAGAAPRGRKRRSSAPDVFHHIDNIPRSTDEDPTGDDSRRPPTSAAGSPFQESSPERS